MYDDWVMVVSKGLVVHLKKAKKAISPSLKSSITQRLSCFFRLLGIEEWRWENELLEKTEKEKKEREKSKLFLELNLGFSGPIFCPLIFLFQWLMLFSIQSYQSLH